MLVPLIFSDLRRKRIINLSLFLFILLPALLMSAALSMICSLTVSLDELFERAKIPHFVQMHAGHPDLEKIETWNGGRKDIVAFQAVQMITIDGSELFFSKSGESETAESEAASVMDLGFVRQNSLFDYLLDLENTPAALDRGEIAVPLYFRDKRALEIGDTVILRNGDGERAFRIASFTRDAQMNPSLIHSKRFMVSDDDFEILKESHKDIEFLLEYRLNDPDRAQSFALAYGSAGLPASGPAVTISLFRIINALSDGMTITILILISILFCITAVLCLRFTLIASLEEEYRAIGVMKGIGFPHGFIRNLYLGKYLVIGGTASLLGFALSFLMYRAMTAHMRLYMGEPPREWIVSLSPLGGAGIIFLTVCLSCLAVLRRFHSVSAVEALRAGRVPTGGRGIRLLSLSRFSLPDLNLTLALRDILLRSRMFLILGLVFFFCSFIILVPLNFLNTIESPEFISYMGIGRSDIRIDIRPGVGGQMRFDRIFASLKADPDIEALVPASTYRCRVYTDESEGFHLNVDTGDFAVFPLEYLEGRLPRAEGEIALSLLNAQEMGVQPGDRLSMLDGDGSSQIEICGIYQDVTNGGYTAKAFSLPSTVKGDALRHTLSLDLRRGVRAERKIREYSLAFAPARVTDIETYLEQTLGETIGLLRKITALAFAAALAGCLLITSLFLRMILAKDRSVIAIMKGTGFSQEDIGKQYLMKILLVLVLGIFVGTLTANSAGQDLVSALWSLMGASSIRFVINPVRAYVLVPAALALSVILTAGIAMRSGGLLDSCRIADLNAE